jgi:hypothetical protein
MPQADHAAKLALLKRRAELLAQQPPRYGGDRKSQRVQGSSSSIDELDPAKRHREAVLNRKARLLYGTPDRAACTEDYIARTRAAGHLPSVNGALANAGAMKHPRKRTRSSSHTAGQNRRDFIAAVTELADGQPHPLGRVAGIPVLPGLPCHLRCLRAVRLIPWITLEYPDAEHAIVRVDQKLRDYIADYRAGNKVPEASGVGAFVRHLRAELNRRHGAFIEEREKVARWTTRNQHWQHYKGLVDWVFSELDRVVKD